MVINFMFYIVFIGNMVSLNIEYGKQFPFQFVFEGDVNVDTFFFLRWVSSIVQTNENFQPVPTPRLTWNCMYFFVVGF